MVVPDADHRDRFQGSDSPATGSSTDQEVPILGSSEINIARGTSDPEIGKQQQCDAGGGDGSPAVDGGWVAWGVVLSSFLVQFVVFGNVYMFAIFIAEYKEKVFPLASTASIAAIQSTGSAVLFVTGAVNGRLAEAYGYRPVMVVGSLLLVAGLILASFSTELWHLVLTQGIMTGLGGSMAYFPAVSLPSQWWVKHRSRAMGLAISGSGVGAVAFVPIAKVLSTKFGPLFALRLMAFGFLPVLIFANLLVRTRVALRDRSAGMPLIDLHLLRDKRFLPLALGSMVLPIGFLGPLYYLRMYVTAVEAPVDGAMLLQVVHGMSIAGRVLVSGKFAPLAGNFNTYICCLLLSGAVQLVLWLPAGTNVPTLVVFSVLYGWFSGGFVGLLPTVLAQIHGIERLPSMFGLIYMVTAIGQFSGPPMLGAIITAAKNSKAWTSFPAREYTPAILVAGLIFFVGAGIMMYLRFLVLDRRLMVRL